MSYQIHAWVPYEGSEITHYDTLEEVQKALKGIKDTYYYSVYEITREIPIEEILG